jgi:hypothetical protein
VKLLEVRRYLGMSAPGVREGLTTQDFVKTVDLHASTTLKVSWEGQVIYFEKHVEMLTSTLMAAIAPMYQSDDLRGIILAFSTRIPSDVRNRQKNSFGGVNFFWRSSDDIGPTSWLLSVMKLLRLYAQAPTASLNGMEVSLLAQLLTDLKSYPPYTQHT